MIITITVTPYQYALMKLGESLLAKPTLDAAILTAAAKAGSPAEPVASSAASAAHPSASAPAEIPTPVTSTEELYNLSK